MKRLLVALSSLLILAQPMLAQESFAPPQDEMMFAIGGNGDFVLNLGVYPNPSSTGNFTVSFNVEESASGTISIRVYNLIGREVFADRIDARDGGYREQISLGALPKGVYMLEVSNGQQKQTRRLSFM